MSTRISTDLGNPQLIKLLKLEAQETNSTMKGVLIRILEAYYANRLETKALQRASESAFTEWNNPLDSQYDKL